MLVQDLVDLSETVITIFTVILLVILFPIVIPVTSSFCREPRLSVEESLLTRPHYWVEDDVQDLISSAIEAKKENVELPSALQRQRLITQRQTDPSAAMARALVIMAVRHFIFAMGKCMWELFSLVLSMGRTRLWYPQVPQSCLSWKLWCFVQCSLSSKPDGFVSILRRHRQ